MKITNLFLIIFALMSSVTFCHIKKTINNTTVHIIQGDIIQCPVDVIVNAANEQLSRGAGVCGAIFKAAEGNGTQLQDYIKTYYKNGIKTGKAVITPSFNLTLQGIKNIIHAVGPDYRKYKNKNDEAKKEAAALLKSSYSNSLQLAQNNNLTSIAFPFISSAIYDYPKSDAATIALETIINFAKTNKGSITDIYFVLYETNDYDLFKKKFGFNDSCLESYLVNRPLLFYSGLIGLCAFAYIWWNRFSHVPTPEKSVTSSSFSFFWPSCF